MAETSMIPFSTGGEGLSAGVGGALGALFGEWFGNGGPNGRWNGSSVTTDAVLTGNVLNELSSISEQVGNVNTTLLQSQATQNAALCQGFSGINESIYRSSANTDQNLCAGFANVVNAIKDGDATTRFENMTNFNGLGRQLAECCCNTQTSLSNGFGKLALENCQNTGRIVDAIQAEGGATRALINQNYIHELETKLCDAKSKISSLESQAYTAGVIANQSQVFDAKLNGAVANIISHVKALIPTTTTTTA